MSAIEHWQRVGEQRAAELAGSAGLPPQAVRVLGASDFVHEVCSTQPELFGELLAGGLFERPMDREEYTALAGEAAAAAADEAALMQAMRRLRRQHMLRIAWRDIAGLDGFDRIVGETSWLADAIIDAALDRLYAWTCERRGTPCAADGTPQRLVVLALGKLGAGELNFSSDIDLIFAFPEVGETRDGPRSESNDEFFVRLSRRLIHVLDQVNADGHVYRVDMRLRPFGGGGPLVTSFSAVEAYYQSHGRDWERYALIRARVVAGDRQAGAALLRALQPFIYRRYLDFSALESIREMKAMINAEVRREGLHGNVKIGPGGIREVEFIAQAFQLVRGGRTPELRRREVQTVLGQLARLGLLPEHAARDLGEAYRFLRTVEHRLQQVDDHQTHLLPTDTAQQARLAFATGHDGWPALQRELERHRAHVREHFDQIFGAGEAQDEATPPDPLHGLLDAAADADRLQALLDRAGFGEHAAAAAEPLRQLLCDVRVRTLGERGHQRLQRLLPDLVRAAASTPAPLRTLERLCAVLQTIVQRSVYLSLLVERPLALSQLVRLCSGSALIANHILRYPLVIDELLDSRTLYAPLRKAALQTEFAASMEAIDSGDLEQEMETLRREKQTNVLRVAAADLAQALPLMVVSDHLTEIAEVCVEHALRLAWRDVSARHGEPRFQRDGESHAAGMAVIAYGKLGGIELSYGSDLDLVYVHSSCGEAQVTDGARPLDNVVFFARVAQRLGHILSTRTPSGVLYEVDVRLRPDGGKGLLVTSIDGFAHYQRESAWTWEHQALVRARVISGDPALAARFAEVRREILLRERDGEALRAEVRDMRRRMRSELDSRDAARFDLKQGAGGIADIEFMVQYLVLRWASRLGEHLVYTDNIRLLEGIERSGILPADRTCLLADAYRAYRSRVHALALQDVDAVVDATEFVDTRAAVSAVWQELMED